MREFVHFGKERLLVGLYDEFCCEFSNELFRYFYEFGQFFVACGDIDMLRNTL